MGVIQANMLSGSVSRCCNDKNMSWIGDFMTKVRNKGVIIPREILTVYCGSKAVICTQAHNLWSVPWIKYESAKAWDQDAAFVKCLRTDEGQR
ncbi:hypothetical protein QJS04_geneDACA022550 [Acorus gramineus]|uniref:Uncharacterized protein n=1 Tax=Acorus gramineus TaxID=55184 RepID=A0AAV9A9Q2_ACOGR|nr:hypothetical protein QJS04_geneDACA022550 [Acorus gramineus]